MEEGEGRPSGSPEGASETGSGERQQPPAARTADRSSCEEAVCQREEAVRARHGGPPHQPNVPQAHRQLRQETDRRHGR